MSNRTSFSLGVAAYAILGVSIQALSGCGTVSSVSLPPSGSLAKHSTPTLRDATSKSANRSATPETVLYSFGTHQPDGIWPLAGLTEVKGTLYGGTTHDTVNRSGAFFSVTPSGSETLLHVFTKNQGHYFIGSLIVGPTEGRRGTVLYGAGYYGGSAGDGTIFSISLSGHVTVLRDFTGGNDGANPWGELIDANGTLYGTTESGGGSSSCNGGCGTVFSMTPSGAETVIHRFNGTDGDLPRSGLVNLDGTLYGTTFYGGAHGDGTVFSVSPSGTLHDLYDFQGGKDGANPEAALVAVDGSLYGTTLEGGDETCPLGFSGCGTVFSITPSGTESVLHRFTGGADGTYPFGTLLDVNGKLYGTTIYGGRNDVGTIFQVKPAGRETVIYSFTGGEDGAEPNGRLIKLGHSLYGTTEYGGSGCQYQSGCGTIFSLAL